MKTKLPLRLEPNSFNPTRAWICFMDIDVIPAVAPISRATNRTTNEAQKVLQPVSIGRLYKRHFLFVVKGQIKVVKPEKASLFIHEYVSSSKIANPLFPTMQS